jgi:eukaryotic-like serine/threonine-protein kinase
VGLFGWLGSLFGGGGKRKGPKLKRIDVSKRFELMGRTGQGSMSKVWKARDRELGRTVCLKILDKKKTDEFEARFPGLNRPLEGVICTALRHKNIVQTFEYGLTRQGEQYLVMELIDGDGLNLLVETNSTALNGKRIDLLAQACDALEYIHGQRYLHRDICPRNMMVTREGLLKMIDFGLTIPYTPEFCKPGNRTGTTNYLAPELIKRSSTDHRVDLFAMGVTAYEMFTGQLPWEKAPSLQTLQKHMNQPGRDPRLIRPELDPHIARVLQKSIEREPPKRFQTAAEFRDALRALPKQDY